MKFQRAYFSGLFKAPSDSKHKVVGGFYDTNLVYIKESALVRNYIEFQGEMSSFHPKSNISSVQERCHYGGMILKHFGHFLLETLSRLSDIPNDASTVVFTIRPNIGINKISDLPYNSIRLLEYALGDLTRCRLVVGPCMFEKINFPTSGYIIQEFMSKRHFEFMQGVGAKIKEAKAYRDLRNRYANSKVWLSRSSLSNNNIEGEFLFEKYLTENGFKIVKPENLSLEEQISIFENATVVSGFTGTAFHPAILAEKIKSHLLHFIRTKEDNRNFFTCLKYRECEKDYIETFIDVKKSNNSVIFLHNLNKASDVLLSHGYVSKTFRESFGGKYKKHGFEREFALSEILSTYSSETYMNKAIDTALNIARRSD